MIFADLSQSTNTSLLLKSASLQQKRFSVNGGNFYLNVIK